MPNAPAARITDQVKHTEAMNFRRVGAVVGGVLGFMAGCALVGLALTAEVVTAGLATPLVAVAVVVGAGLVIGGSTAVAASAFSNQGAHIGQNIPGVDEGPIATGIPSIHIGSERHVAAYLGSKVLCNRHQHSLPDSVEFVAQGSRSVRLGTGRFPAARVGDKGTCDCKIGHGCDTVIIGGETITVGRIDLSGDDPEAAFFNKLGEVGGVAFLAGTALLAIPAGLAAGGFWGAVRAAAWAGLKFEATSKVIGGVINRLPEGPLRDTANSLATILPIFHGGEKAGGEEPGGAPSEAPTGEGTGTEGTGTEGTGTEGGTDAARARGGAEETGNGSGLPAPSEAPAGAGPKGADAEGAGSEGDPTHPIGDSPGGLRGGEETGGGEESKTDGNDGKEETPPEETEPPEDKIYRKDRVPDSPDGRKPGSRKSYIDENGDLQPANSEGRATVQQHVRGSEPAKSDSPYTSFSDQLGTSKDYGGDLITLDRGRLSQDIADGKVDGVDILNHEDVLAAHDGYIADAQARYDANPTPKNLERLERAQQDRANSVRDREVLVKGTVPGEYVSRTPADPPADPPADTPPPDSGGTPPGGGNGGTNEGGGSEGGGSEDATPPADAAGGGSAGDPLVQFGERPGGMPGEAPPEQAGGGAGESAADDGDPTVQPGDRPGGLLEGDSDSSSTEGAETPPEAARTEARAPAGRGRGSIPEDTLNQWAQDYADNVNSDRVWNWNENMDDQIPRSVRADIKQRAVDQGLIANIPINSSTTTPGFADFRGHIRNEVQMPEFITKPNGETINLWRSTDDVQFRWLDNRVRQIDPTFTNHGDEGYTWHHHEGGGVDEGDAGPGRPDGRMQLVERGIHNATTHSGGRSDGRWADAPR